jgi:hypothetical protein
MGIQMADIFKDNWKRYKDLGLIPYPASPKGKNPIPQWRDDSVPTNDLFSEWERKYFNANVWVRLGDRFAVIDPDGPGAEEFVQSLSLPLSPTSISGNKSIHRWFKVSSPIKPFKVQNGDGTFLEVRTGSMGMIVPPSIHPLTGKAYQWFGGHSPWDIPFPELPMSVYQKILALTKKTEPKMELAQTENPSLGSLDVKKYLDKFGVKYEIKRDGNRVIYALEKCLFIDQHTTPSNEGDSSIIQGADGKLGYHCFHNHCSFRTWRDARASISGNASIAEFCHGYKAPGERKDAQEKAIISLKQAILDADQIRVMDFPEKRKILSPWLSEQTLVLVPGWRGVGKTWFALGLCDAITRKINFGSWPTVTPIPCLYIDGEMAIQDIKERVEALANSVSEKRKEPLLIYSDFYGNSQGIPKANLLNHKWRNAIKQITLDWSIKLLVLDNLSSLCPGIEENSKLDWDPVNQWLLDLRFAGLSVLMLHHTNKEGNQRGTSGREGNIDISILLTQPADYVPEDGCRFILKFSKARIRTTDLHLIQDTEFHLKETNGRLEWTHSGTKRKNRVEILRLLSEKVSQKEISEILGLSKGRVSQIRLSLMEDDYISPNGEITIKGKGLLNEK